MADYDRRQGAGGSYNSKKRRYRGEFYDFQIQASRSGSIHASAVELSPRNRLLLHKYVTNTFVLSNYPSLCPVQLPEVLSDVLEQKDKHLVEKLASREKLT
jgi:hypothetical protein